MGKGEGWGGASAGCWQEAGGFSSPPSNTSQGYTSSVLWYLILFEKTLDQFPFQASRPTCVLRFKTITPGKHTGGWKGDLAGCQEVVDLYLYLYLYLLYLVDLYLYLLYLLYLLYRCFFSTRMCFCTSFGW